MDFTVFKDIPFDLVNECGQYEIKDLQAIDRENRLIVSLEDGPVIEITLRELLKK